MTYCDTRDANPLVRRDSNASIETFDSLADAWMNDAQIVARKLRHGRRPKKISEISISPAPVLSRNGLLVSEALEAPSRPEGPVADVVCSHDLPVAICNARSEWQLTWLRRRIATHMGANDSLWGNGGNLYRATPNRLLTATFHPCNVILVPRYWKMLFSSS